MSRALDKPVTQDDSPVASACSARLYLSCAALLALVALPPARPAQAQISGNFAYDSSHFAYFVHGDTTVNGDISGNEVFLGKDNASSFKTLNTQSTLSVTDGALMTQHGNWYPNGKYQLGLNVFGKNKANIAGGQMSYANGYDASTINISGGTMTEVDGDGKSTVNITGGNLLRAKVSGTLTNSSSTFNISGGSVGGVEVYGTSLVNISGGSLGDVYCLGESTVNLSGGSAGAALAFGSDTFIAKRVSIAGHTC
jgi:hypothetical protein